MCVSKKLGGVQLGTKCLFQKGNKRERKSQDLCTCLPDLVPNPAALVWPGMVFFKQQHKLIATHYICPHFRQVFGRWPNPKSHVSLWTTPQCDSE